MDELFLHFVEHSQNRSQGYAVNFFKSLSEKKTKEKVKEEEERRRTVLKVIKKFQFKLDDDLDYLRLFVQFKKYDIIRNEFSLKKGKDIQYLELAKTSQCIRRYLKDFDKVEDFFAHEKHRFSSDAGKNWKNLQEVANSIYNMDVALVADSFKEHLLTDGRDYLVKFDVHMKSFFNDLFSIFKKRTNYETDINLSPFEIYKMILNSYKNEGQVPEQRPYKLDKMIFHLGILLKEKNDYNEFLEKASQAIEMD